jgi:hypothetical protein
MPTLSVRSASNDGWYSSVSLTSFAQARDGFNGANWHSSQQGVAGNSLQGGNQYSVNQTFQDFDTSSIPDGAVITGVVLKLTLFQDNVDSVSQTLEARAFDYGTHAPADWRTGAQLAALTRLATYAASANPPLSEVSFTEDGTNFRNAINKTGSTRMVIVSNRAVGTGNTPSNLELIGWYGGGYGTSTLRPLLEVTYTMPEVLGSATIAGSASGTMTGTVTRLAAAALAGAAVLALTGEATRLAAASLGGVGVLDCSAQMTRPAAVMLAGATALSADAGVTRLAAATLVNQATVSATPTREINASALLAGSSGLSGTARLVTVLRPIADVTNEGGDTGGSWVPSSGFDLWDMLNEDLPDDADYITSPSPVQQGEVELRLQPGSLPIGGTVTIVFRARTV